MKEVPNHRPEETEYRLLSRGVGPKTKMKNVTYKEAYTLVELLGAIFIIGVTIGVYSSINSAHGIWAGVGAAMLTSAFSTPNIQSLQKTQQGQRNQQFKGN